MFAGIALKIISAFAFTLMAALIRWIGDAAPAGQVVFARSLFALIPVGLWLAWGGQLGASIRTRNLGGHWVRSLMGVASMFLSFSALALLPLPDATVIGYASPLMAVFLAFFMLGERVGIYRWSAVMAGLFGVTVILWPQLSGGTLAQVFSGRGEEARLAQGALYALGGAFCSANAMIQVRRLTQTESTGSIVLYFTLISVLIALATAPFGWVWPEPMVLLALAMVGIFGGIGQILMVAAYRAVEASLIAPFEYTTILWALLIGWFAFGDAPGITVYAGAAIIVASGIFVILRERWLGIERARARAAEQPPTT